MGRLLLVRHGQASDLRGVYDQLSARGMVQAEHVGVRLFSRDAPIDRVYVGPLKRHVQTLAGARLKYPDLPEAISTPALDEHQGELILKGALKEGDGGHEDLNLPRLLGDSMRAWAREKRVFPGVTEPFEAFRARCAQAVRDILGESRAARAKTVAVFTSGGVVGAAVGACLELSDAHTVELCFMVDNAAITELLFSSAGKVTLRAFNDTSHLPRDQVTPL